MKLLNLIIKEKSAIEWNPTCLYKSGDIITYKGQVYKSFKKNKNENPVTSKYWISIT